MYSAKLNLIKQSVTTIIFAYGFIVISENNTCINWTHSKFRGKKIPIVNAEYQKSRLNRLFDTSSCIC